MSKENHILVRLNEQDALDLSILVTEKLADLIQKRRFEVLSASEYRMADSLRRIQDRIDAKLLALHQEPRPALRLIDGKSTQD